MPLTKHQPYPHPCTMNTPQGPGFPDPFGPMMQVNFLLGWNKIGAKSITIILILIMIISNLVVDQARQDEAGTTEGFVPIRSYE